MTHTAAIKIAPCFTIERFEDSAWRSDRTMYESGSLRFLPSKDTVPLLVNHDEEWEIGVVHELFKMDWVDGPWIVARCTVENPPSWMQRHRRASFGFKLLRRREANIRGMKADVIAGAIVTEVSVLSESVEPAEPAASVLSFRPMEAKPSLAAVPNRAVAGEVVWGGRWGADRAAQHR
jgi:hypothetical protein